MTGSIDTHCHLDAVVFDNDRDEVVQHARDAGVSGLVIIGHDPPQWSAVTALAHQLGVVHTIGLHPNLAHLWEPALAQRIRDTAVQTGAVGIGETGLDFFRDSADADQQRAAFSAQIEISRDLDLPLIIHQREAFHEVRDLVTAHGPARGIFHCFTGSVEEAEQAIALGFVLGIGGVLTFPRSDALREAVQQLPAEALVLETDSPYLAPRSRRGQRNEPACVSEVADVLADVRGVTRAEIIATTSANAARVFGCTPGFSTPLEVRG